MNKFKIWEIESLWEQNFSKPKKNPTDFFSAWKNFLIQKKLKKNYKKKESKFCPNFFLQEKFSFATSSKKVFSGEDRTKKNSEEKKNFFGLSKQQVIFCKGKIIYLIDNHNKALFSFWEISKILKKKFDIVHIDAHRDDSKFEKKIPEKIDKKNIKWCLENSSVSNYLDLAKKSGLVKKIFSITQEKEFEEFCKAKFLLPKKYILNLDIDIFGPEGEYVSTEKKVKAISKAWKNSKAIVIATSPGYIDQKTAEKIIKIFTK